MAMTVQEKIATGVCNLEEALEAYWAANSHRESQAAYHEVILFGGDDGWAPSGPVRSWLARQARRFALWIERRDLTSRAIHIPEEGESKC
jgi:hypothetical protein